MKRKLLIPLLTTTALTPTIAMVGCGVTSFNLEELGGGSMGDETAFWKQNVNLSANTWYTANVDVSKSSVLITDESICSFMVGKLQGFEPLYLTQITKAEIYDRTKQLEQIYTSDVGKDQFYINTTDQVSVISIGANTVTNESQFKIKFQINENVKQFTLIFSIDAGTIKN